MCLKFDAGACWCEAGLLLMQDCVHSCLKTIISIWQLDTRYTIFATVKTSSFGLPIIPDAFVLQVRVLIYTVHNGK